MYFFKAFGGYAIGSAFVAGAGFLSIPILIRVLGKQEYGHWVLLEPIILIGTQLAMLGVNAGIFKQVAHDGIPVKYAFRKLVMAAQPVAILIAVLLSLGVGKFGYSSAEQVLVALLIWFEAVLFFGISSLRAANLPSQFTVIQVVRSVALIVILSISLLGWFLVDSADDVLIIRFIVACIAILFVVSIMPKEKNACRKDGKIVAAIGLNKESAYQLYTDAVRYGFPLLITGLLIVGFQFSERFILKSVTDYDVLAEYIIHVKVVSALNLTIVTPFSLWWPTERFIRRKDADGGQAFFSAAANVFLIVLLAVGGCLWVVAEWLLPVFAPSVVFNAHVMLVLILSAVFFAMSYPLNIGLLDKGKTQKTIWGALIGLSIQIALCLLLIPRFGALGAAYASLAGSFMYAISLHVLSQKVYKVKFSYAAMTLFVFLSVIFLISISVIFPAYEKGGSLALVSKIFIYLIFLIYIGRLLGVDFHCMIKAAILKLKS